MYIANSIYKNCIEKILSKDFEIFKNKTFFITGASGLVGSFLVDTLMYLNIKYNYANNSFIISGSISDAIIGKNLCAFFSPNCSIKVMINENASEPSEQAKS